MSRLWRVTMLALALARRSIGRTVTMMTMLALALVLFLVTSALADASSSDLRSAVREVNGPPGLMYIDVPRIPSLSRSETASALAEALSREAGLHHLVVEPLPDLRVSCTGQSGDQRSPGDGRGPSKRTYVGVVATRAASATAGVSLTGAEGSSMAVSSAEGVSVGGCVDGVSVPAEAFQPAPAALAFLQPDAVVISPAYLPLARTGVSAESHRSASWRVLAWSDAPGVSPKEDVARACREATDLARVMDGLSDDICVVQQPPDHAGLRRAGAGVELVYRVLGAAVLCLGAVGVLVAESIIVRDRRWLFGMARAYGARGTDIGLLVVLDVVVVLCGAGLITAGAVSVWQPFVEEWSRSTLSTQITLYRPSDLGYLAAGCAGVLLVAGVGPAFKAVRGDPLDVLERRD
ncbi:FtsX-like permease family protein [Austwickia chelonae]|uniref:ABC3 transporter permease C-terminal domain-containing protein n=1 Tax=Austwickia chelonae NBRC 105200 TaxID=1184607 RepID=K6W8R6_9MICO|nr:FtsX-like permease family protein [Austwickia chelonae]GAB78217.1 hypothetical protein AUCHE_08_04630 [Austwickia chelonae NBRC 105200]SEV98895.1 FtsX-like permease family protein [Austwickia chelonae]